MSLFVTVQNNRAVLRGMNGPITTFGSDVKSAILQGNDIIVTTNSSRTQIYQLSQSGVGVVGPVRTI